MTYIVPQALVYQELQTVPAELTDPLRPHISGGHAFLARYAESSEKVLGLLGAYDPVSDQAYSWPNKPTGAIVDQDYTKIFIDNALLEYYHEAVGGDNTIAPVSGKTDRVRASSVAFRENTSDYPRSDDFYDRDVANGDIVYLRGDDGDEVVELWTYVRGVAYEQTAAVTAAATSDDDNIATGTASSHVALVAGTANCVSLEVDLTDYNAWVDGNISDTYTVEVVRGSTNEDFTTARVRIISASGADDVATFAPSADSEFLTVGSRGLQIAFATALSGGDSCPGPDTSISNDLLVGQKWEITIVDNSEAAVPTSGGTYTGTTNTTYVVEVSRGGLFEDDDETRRPQITARTIHGTDLSSPTNVTAVDTAVAVGTKGVTIKFTKAGGTLLGLRKGDKFYIDVTASANGRCSTLILGHALGTLVNATDMEMTLYIKKNIQVGKNRIGFAPITNWATSATEVTLSSGIVAYDATWTDGGTELPLDVKGGTAYVEYRAWQQTYVDSVYDIADVGDLDDLINGPLTPDNPLKYGVYLALLNANGTVVKFTAVSDPDDPLDWLPVLELLDGRNDVYNAVPLTYNATVIAAFQAHVNAQSAADHGRWRAMFVGLKVDNAIPLVASTTSSDGEVVLATIGDDPETSGTQYTWLEVTSGNANFVESGVAAGDIVRAIYTTDGFDGESYTEYVVETVVNEDSLRLAAGPDAAVNTAQKIEVWHTRTKPELVTALKAQCGAYGSRRVCPIWPDQADIAGNTVDGYFLGCIAAGRRAGIVPQQGMTNLALTGITAVPRTTKYFSASQLNDLAASGAFIITQADTGEIHPLHALTSDMSSLNTREEMYRANLDSISYFLLNSIKKYIGVSNVTPQLLATLRVELDSAIDTLKTNSLVGRIGGQLIDGTIVDLRQHVLLKDRVVAVLNLTLPYPLNNAEIYLVA